MGTPIDGRLSARSRVIPPSTDATPLRPVAKMAWAEAFRGLSPKSGGHGRRNRVDDFFRRGVGAFVDLVDAGVAGDHADGQVPRRGAFVVEA